MSRIINKEFKWKHDSYRDRAWDGGLPPKKRNGLERKLNHYNHIMEFVRTILAFTTLGLQLIILYRLFN